MLVLPQTPYLPAASLRGVVAYPLQAPQSAPDEPPAAAADHGGSGAGDDGCVEDEEVASLLVEVAARTRVGSAPSSPRHLARISHTRQQMKTTWFSEGARSIQTIPCDSSGGWEGGGLQSLRSQHLQHSQHSQLGLGEVLRRFGLDGVAAWERVLSLGEQQRLAFARLFLVRPAFALMDEVRPVNAVNAERLDSVGPPDQCPIRLTPPRSPARWLDCSFRSTPRTPTTPSPAALSSVWRGGSLAHRQLPGW